MKKIGIIGISGRVGQSLYTHCMDSSKYTCSGGYDTLRPSHGSLYPSLTDLFASCDYAVDFSSPDLVPGIIAACLAHPKPLIIGTTGTALLKEKVQPLAEVVPVVIAPNTSLGACVQRHLAASIARLLPETYDIDIIERHHRHKKDQPSGTALALAEAIENEKKKLDQPYTVESPHSPRSWRTIQITSLRSGQIPAEHEITATSAYESLTIIHKVFHKDLFAQGVLTILDWLETKNPIPGLYTMEDVLGI